MVETYSPNEEFGRWIDQLATPSRFGAKDRRGTANLIDPAARLRAAEATGALMVAAPAIPRATGSLVQPLFIQ